MLVIYKIWNKKSFYSLFKTKSKKKKKRAETVTSKNKLKELEQHPDYFFDRNYLDSNNKLEQVYEGKAVDVKIRSKREWYEFGEKSSNLFLKNQVWTLLCGKKEVTDEYRTNQEVECFHKNLFTEKSEFQKEHFNAYLNQINIPILTEEHSQTCEAPISEILNALKSMPNNKSPGNDGLTREFYETFWEEVKSPLCNRITKSYQNGELSISQRQ